MTDFDSKVQNSIARISKNMKNPEIDSLFNGYKNTKKDDFVNKLSVDLLAGALVYVSNYQGTLKNIPVFFNSDIFLFSVDVDVEELTEEQIITRDNNVKLFENIVEKIKMLNNNSKKINEIKKKINQTETETKFDPSIWIKLSLVRYIRSIVYL